MNNLNNGSHVTCEGTRMWDSEPAIICYRIVGGMRMKEERESGNEE